MKERALGNKIGAPFTGDLELMLLLDSTVSHPPYCTRQLQHGSRLNIHGTIRVLVNTTGARFVNALSSVHTRGLRWDD